MKKILLFLLTLGLLVSTGCASVSKTPPSDPIFSCQSGTDVPGVTVRIDEVTVENGRIYLTVTWDNRTEHNVMYGEIFSIDRLEGDDWVSCAMAENTAFTTVGYMLNCERTVTKTYNIYPLFDVSTPGTYRFKSSCSVGKQECKLWAEFSVSQPEIPDGSVAVPFVSSAVRTDGYSEGRKYPNVTLISSLEALDAYYLAHKDGFDLERKEIYFPGPSETGFLNICDRLDAAYFRKHQLILVTLEEGSGSIRHNVDSVALTADQKLSISIRSIVPEICTDDMAQWHLILEIDQDVEIGCPENVMVYLDDQLAWDGKYVAPPEPEVAYKEPPEMLVVTPEGEIVIKASGYDWIYDNINGTTSAVIADQAARPAPLSTLEAITIDQKHVETVYAYAKPGQYEPTNMLGYMVKLHFDVCPSSLSYTCWAASDSSREESVEYFREDPAFYAKDGGYIYEISAAWEDTGAGYHGSANYYVYIVGGHHAVPIICD